MAKRGMEPVERLKEVFLGEAESLKEKFISLSDFMYQCPEAGFSEFKASTSMQALLREAGFSVETGIAGMATAFRAVYGEGSPAIALLAEMDALPDMGHGCGHNIGGSASVGAAVSIASAVKRSGAPFKGKIVVLGTPAEETGSGKAVLVRKGIFKGIDAAMMVHASAWRTVVKNFLGLVELRFAFTGKGSHASAYPEEGINALDAVIQTFNSINALRQQLREDVRVHGIITDGGRAPNIIPERAGALFYVRAMDLKELASVKEKVIRCAEGAATSTGCSLKVEEAGEPTSPMKINRPFADIYRKALGRLGLAEDQRPSDRNLGSSDIGDVSQAVPTIHPHVPVRPGIRVHTREFADATATPDGHRALMEGVKCLGLTAIELLYSAEALDRIWKDFKGTPG